MTPQSFVWATVDNGAGLVLLTGRGLLGALEEAGLGARARWSAGRRGYVIALTDFADFAAHLDLAHVPYRIRQGA